MYARVTNIQLQAGKTAQAVGIYRDFVVPAAKRQKGFQSLLLLTDANTGKGLSISIWETQDAMKAGEASGYFQEQVARFGSLVAAPPVRECYELSVQA